MRSRRAAPPRSPSVPAAAGARRGTYTLDEPAEGATRTFELEWLQIPLIERLTAPLARGFVRRGGARSLRRLAERLAGR
jgi:hypothetical protein